MKDVSLKKMEERDKKKMDQLKRKLHTDDEGVNNNLYGQINFYRSIVKLQMYMYRSIFQFEMYSCSMSVETESCTACFCIGWFLHVM